MAIETWHMRSKSHGTHIRGGILLSLYSDILGPDHLEVTMGYDNDKVERQDVIISYLYIIGVWFQLSQRNTLCSVIQVKGF